VQSASAELDREILEKFRLLTEENQEKIIAMIVEVLAGGAA
jgi:hypothetical protein